MAHVVLQAHHCRSMIPCQDSPSVKHTYYAQVTHAHTPPDSVFTPNAKTFSLRGRN